MLRHLGHEVFVIEEEEADHSDDEEDSTSGLVRDETKYFKKSILVNICHS